MSGILVAGMHYTVVLLFHTREAGKDVLKLLKQHRPGSMHHVTVTSHAVTHHVTATSHIAAYHLSLVSSDYT
jgi:hypothetical protein